MGNSNSRSSAETKSIPPRNEYQNNDKSTNNQLAAPTTSSNIKTTMSRSASGAEISENKYLTQFVPVEKLSEILQEKSQKFNVNGIVSEVFVSQVFPRYSDLGHRLFQLLHHNSRAQTEYLGTVAFRQQCERFLGIMDDAKILECYIRMYAEIDRPDFINKQGVTRLLLTCYQVAMDHSGNIVLCPAINRTFDSVVRSIFFNQDSLSIGFVCRWFEQNLIRSVLLVHKYCLHTLSTAYRGLEQDDQSQSSGIELSTPVIEQRTPFPEQSDTESNTLMPMSQAWLLAGALPPLYTKPQTVVSQSANKSASAAQIFKDKLSMLPSHWTLLYDSNEHGLGSNRFLHHLLGYRGPTLILLNTEDGQKYCIGSPNEWKETHLFTGAEGSVVLQLLPKFAILEKKPNILYLNTCVRGYPKGLRAGADPKKPILSVDEHFEKIDCKGIAAGLTSIEIWGCGDKSSREVQLDIKKWQIKEAERQRTVKLTAADWMDHPDRYLLELGGRQNYNN